jgi:hypothetical protein
MLFVYAAAAVALCVAATALLPHAKRAKMSTGGRQWLRDDAAGEKARLYWAAVLNLLYHPEKWNVRWSRVRMMQCRCSSTAPVQIPSTCSEDIRCKELAMLMSMSKCMILTLFYPVFPTSFDLPAVLNDAVKCTPLRPTGRFCSRVWSAVCSSWSILSTMLEVVCCSLSGTCLLFCAIPVFSCWFLIHVCVCLLHPCCIKHFTWAQLSLLYACKPSCIACFISALFYM